MMPLPPKQAAPKADQRRQQRLAAALRANLQRRKAMARAVAADGETHGDAPEGEAAAPDSDGSIEAGGDETSAHG